MSKILPGSIVQNQTNLQQGSVVDQIIDRGAQLFSHQQITFTGTSIIATRPIEITFQDELGKYRANKIRVDVTDLFQAVAGTLPLANDEVIVAQLDRTTSYTLTVTSATRATNVTTFQTSASHGLQIGDRITVSGMTASSFNGNFYVLSIPAANQITVANVGIDESASVMGVINHSNVKLTATAWSNAAPYLAAGQYSITSIDNLQKLIESSKDLVVLFIRKDTTDGAPTLLIPLHKQLLDAGQTVSLGASGSGDGDATGLETVLRDRFAFSINKYLDMNIFKRDKDTKVDGASTGAYSLLKKAFEFDAIGKTLLSANIVNGEFRAEGKDILEVELYLHWLLANIDPSATYEVTRDGVNFETITMQRIGTTNAFRGFHKFETEYAVSQIVGYAVGNADSTVRLQDTGVISRAQPFTITETAIVRSAAVYLNKLGAATAGKYLIQIVKDNAGAPSTNPQDIIAESDLQNIADLSVGDNAAVVALPTTPLIPGAYWYVISTDAEYKSSYSLGVRELRVRADSSSPTAGNSALYNGTSWTSVPGVALTFFINGRPLDLRIRVTSGTANVFIDGYGVYFGSDDGLITPNGDKMIQKFYFSGDENRTDFALNFQPDVDLLDIIDPRRGQIYAIEHGVARIEGNSVKFASGTFNWPGEQIVLIFRQTKGSTIDNSSTNSMSIAEHSANLADIGEQIGNFDSVQLQMIPAPYTSIVNRSLISDFSQDLKARMGAETIRIQNIIEMTQESGPNGELVYKPSADKFNQIRLVGKWVLNQDANGVCPVNYINSDFAEITFWGTGLQLLSYADNNARTWDYSVDNGSLQTGSYVLTGNAALSTAYKDMQVCLPVVNGLTPGQHTIRIVFSSSGTLLQGFKILNEQASKQIRINPGSQYVKGQKRTLANPVLTPVDATFESGSLSSSGGAVIIYQKADGSIAKKANPAGTTPGYLGGSDHSNEEVVKSFNWQEFGQGETNDFTNQANGAVLDRTWIMSNNSASLVGSFVTEGLYPSGTRVLTQVYTGGASYWQLVFRGTGLDLLMSNPASPISHNITIDGVPVGTLPLISDQKDYIQKLCSNLPYGDHVVRIAKVSAGNDVGLIGWRTYATKMPTVPAGSKLIAQYYKLADFVANTTAGLTAISKGVIRHQWDMECHYVGSGWIRQQSWVNSPTGYFMETPNISDYVHLEFTGEGLDIKFIATAIASTDITVQIDGVNYTGAATAYGGATWTPGTSTLNQNASLQPGAGLVITGLSYGKHSIRLINNVAASMILSSFDVITPIDCEANNGPVVIGNNLLTIENAVLDKRALPWVDEKALSIAMPLIASATTTDPQMRPIQDMIAPIHLEKDARLRISWESTMQCSVIGNSFYARVYIDGKPVGSVVQDIVFNALGITVMSLETTVPVSAGKHVVQIFFQRDGGTVSAYGQARNLTVEER